MVSGPPIVGVPNPASPGPAGVVQAIWANLTFWTPSQAISKPFLWAGPRESLVRLYQGTLNSAWVHYGARPPYCGGAQSSQPRPGRRGAGYMG